MAQPPRERFGRYELVSTMGRGGMAETWRARLLGAAGVTKPVLIKKVLAEYAKDDSFIAMFISEARISATLSHGNIAQVFDFGRVDGDYFLAMEFVDGQPLNRVMKRALKSGFSALPAPIAVFIALEMCKGLHYAHTRRDDKGAPLGIVHRDISPDNVLLGYEGQVKIVDFGIAKALALRGFQTEPGVVKGKYLFFSPEQARGEAVDARTDVWSTGVVLYEMLCGQLPVSGPAYTALPKLVEGEFPSPRELLPELPAELDEIVMRALAVEPDRRFESCHAFGEALAGFLYSAAPRFSSMSVAHLLQELFRKELEAEGREVQVPGSFIEELSVWRMSGAPRTPGELVKPARAEGRRQPPASAPRGSDGARPPRVPWQRWLIPSGLLVCGVLGGLVVAELRDEPSPPPAAAAAAPAPRLLTREPRGRATYPVEAIFLEARRDLIPVPAAATRLPLNPGTRYRLSEPSVPANAPPLFTWLRALKPKASGLEGRLSVEDETVSGGAELLLFALQPLGGDVEREVLVEDMLSRERSTVRVDKMSYTSLEQTFELRGLDEKTTYQLMIQPHLNWAHTRGPGSEVAQAVICVGRASGQSVGQAQQLLVRSGVASIVRGASTLWCGFPDENPLDNKGQVKMTLTPLEDAAPGEPPAPRMDDSSRESRLLLTQADAFWQKHQYGEAEGLLRRCLRVDPSFAPCHLLLAETLMSNERPDEGIEFYRSFLRLAPYHREADRARALVKQHTENRFR